MRIEKTKRKWQNIINNHYSSHTKYSKAKGKKAKKYYYNNNKTARFCAEKK